MKRRLAIKQRLIQKRKELAQHGSEAPNTESLNGKRNAKQDATGVKQEFDHADD